MQSDMSLRVTCLQQPQMLTMRRTRQPISHSAGQLQLQQLCSRRSQCPTVTRAEAEAPSRPSRPQAPAGGGRGGYQGGGGGGRGGGGGYQGRGGGGGYQGRGGGGNQGRGGGGGGGYQGRGGGGYQGRGGGGDYQGRGGGQQQQGGRGYQGQGQGYQQRPPQGQQQGGQQREFSQEPRTNAQQRAQREYQRRQQGGPSDGFVVNDEIRAQEVRLLGEQKEQLGVVSLEKALDLADEAGTDVVLISPDASPPVVRLIEVSKLKYEQEKAKKEASRKSRAARSDLKELKMRPSTDEHDYQVRLRSAMKFLTKGDKVKLTCQFRGREMEFQDIARDMFDRFVKDLEAAEGVPEVSVEARPRMQGKSMNMILGPVSKN